MKQIAVFGFGLVGASLAAAVREASPAIRLVAVDLPAVVSSNAARNLADELVESQDSARISHIAEASDICVLAAPVSVIVAVLPALLDVANVVTDCGSTKRTICASVVGASRRGRFVPGHPMAGGPEGGAAQARADLFRGQTWLLCPEDSDADAVERVEALIDLTGARCVRLPASTHDRAVAYTSHAPQVLASALAVLTARAGAGVAAGPAYRGTTRSAGGAATMWRDIFEANAGDIGVVLRELIAELEAVATGLESAPADASVALSLLAAARALR